MVMSVTAHDKHTAPLRSYLGTEVLTGCQTNLPGFSAPLPPASGSRINPFGWTASGADCVKTLSRNGNQQSPLRQQPDTLRYSEPKCLCPDRKLCGGQGRSSFHTGLAETRPLAARSGPGNDWSGYAPRPSHEACRPGEQGHHSLLHRAARSRGEAHIRYSRLRRGDDLGRWRPQQGLMPVGKCSARGRRKWNDTMAGSSSPSGR
jgi:hypothetical protein